VHSGEGHSDIETHLCSLSIDPGRVINYTVCVLLVKDV